MPDDDRVTLGGPDEPQAPATSQGEGPESEGGPAHGPVRYTRRRVIILGAAFAAGVAAVIAGFRALGGPSEVGGAIGASGTVVRESGRVGPAGIQTLLEGRLGDRERTEQHRRRDHHDGGTEGSRSCVSHRSGFPSLHGWT